MSRRPHGRIGAACRDAGVVVDQQARHPADADAASDQTARGDAGPAWSRPRGARSRRRGRPGRGSRRWTARSSRRRRTPAARPGRRSRQPVLRGHADQEGVLEQVDPLRALELAALGGRVLVAEGDVELAAEKARFERARRHLAEDDAKPAVRGPKAPDRGRHEARERGREGADAHLVAVLAGQAGDLRVGQLQAPADVIGVLEQDRARVRQAQPGAAAVAVEQADADLGLQERDLVRHRRLGERQVLGGPRERAARGPPPGTPSGVADP